MTSNSDSCANTGTVNTDWWDNRRNKIIAPKGGWKVGLGVFNFGLKIQCDVKAATGDAESNSATNTQLTTKEEDQLYIARMRGVGLEKIPFNMMDGLVGRHDYYEVLVLNCTGRLPPKELGTWLNGLFICLSWPDPRLWCNAMGAFSGSLRGRVTSGVTAGILSADSPMFGGTEVINTTTRFMESALQQHDSGVTVAQIVTNELTVRGRVMKKAVIPGFARPLATGDERVTAMRKLARELGFRERRCERLSDELDQYLIEEKGESINIGGYVAAFMLDQGFTREESMRIFATVVHSGVHAGYVEEIENPPLSFKPTPCDDIAYTGKWESLNDPESPVGRDVPSK